MSGIKGFPSQEKGLQEATELGVSFSKIPDNFATVNHVGSKKYALDVLPKAVFPLTALAQTLDGVTQGQRVIFLTAHGARPGDFVRFASGGNTSVEAPIFETPDANTIVLGMKLPSAPTGGTDTVFIMRHITLTLDSSGALITSNGPIQYVRDGLPQQVIKDTVTPANTRPLPVELVSTAGIEATFNVTTGDLNIQSTHDGADHPWDSIRIGDGTNLMAVNASLEAQVRDDDLNTEVAAMNAKFVDGNDIGDVTVNNAAGASAVNIQDGGNSLTVDSPQYPAVLGQTTMANSFAVVVASDQSAIDVNVTGSALPTGAATEAKQDNIITELQSIDAKDFATETTLSALNGKFGTLGQKTMAGSAPVVIASDQSDIDVIVTSSVLPTGAATEVTLASIDSKDFATETTLAAMSAKLPATLGQKTKAASLAVTLASDEDPVITTQQAPDGGSSGTAAVGSSAGTLSAPANAVKVFLQAPVSNTEAVWVGITTPTVGTGWELLPGASLVLEGDNDIEHISASGGQGLNYIWLTRS